MTELQIIYLVAIYSGVAIQLGSLASIFLSTVKMRKENREIRLLIKREEWADKLKTYTLEMDNLRIKFEADRRVEIIQREYAAQIDTIRTQFEDQLKTRQAPGHESN